MTMKNVNRKVGFRFPSIAPTKPIMRDPWRIKRKYNLEPWWYLCEKCVEAYTTTGVCVYCKRGRLRMRL
jgi:hypothetical protein